MESKAGPILHQYFNRIRFDGFDKSDILMKKNTDFPRVNEFGFYVYLPQIDSLIQIWHSNLVLVWSNMALAY